MLKNASMGRRLPGLPLHQQCIRAANSRSRSTLCCCSLPALRRAPALPPPVLSCGDGAAGCSGAGFGRRQRKDGQRPPARHPQVSAAAACRQAAAAPCCRTSAMLPAAPLLLLSRMHGCAWHASQLLCAPSVRQGVPQRHRQAQGRAADVCGRGDAGHERREQPSMSGPPTCNSSQQQRGTPCFARQEWNCTATAADSVPASWLAAANTAHAACISSRLALCTARKLPPPPHTHKRSCSAGAGPEPAAPSGPRICGGLVPAARNPGAVGADF